MRKQVSMQNYFQLRLRGQRDSSIIFPPSPPTELGEWGLPDFGASARSRPSITSANAPPTMDWPMRDGGHTRPRVRVATPSSRMLKKDDRRGGAEKHTRRARSPLS